MVGRYAIVMRQVNGRDTKTNKKIIHPMSMFCSKGEAMASHGLGAAAPWQAWVSRHPLAPASAWGERTRSLLHCPSAFERELIALFIYFYLITTHLSIAAHLQHHNPPSKCLDSTSPSTTVIWHSTLKVCPCPKPPAPEQPSSAASTMAELSSPPIPEPPAVPSSPTRYV